MLDSQDLLLMSKQCTSFDKYAQNILLCIEILRIVLFLYMFEFVDLLFDFRSQRLKFRLNLYELRENRQVKPKTFLSMVSNLLYERRFGPYFVEPVIAGLDPKTLEPFIASLDLIGCPDVTDDFVVSGTCTEQLYGMCESLWEPNMVCLHCFVILFPSCSASGLS